MRISTKLYTWAVLAGVALLALSPLVYHDM
jgi:hypothetical protein